MPYLSCSKSSTCGNSGVNKSGLEFYNYVGLYVVSTRSDAAAALGAVSPAAKSGRVTRILGEGKLQTAKYGIRPNPKG
jgi:hypothetical protein